MSPERVLANPLSGLEIRNAILDKIGKSLARDCYLSDNLAYDFFECDVKISLTAHDVGRAAQVDQEIKLTEGYRPEDAALDAADAEFHVDAEAPNVVRVETGQPVPVLTKDVDGNPTIKDVKYSRKQLEKVQK